MRFAHFPRALPSPPAISDRAIPAEHLSTALINSRRGHRRDTNTGQHARRPHGGPPNAQSDLILPSSATLAEYKPHWTTYAPRTGVAPLHIPYLCGMTITGMRLACIFESAGLAVGCLASRRSLFLRLWPARDHAHLSASTESARPTSVASCSQRERDHHMLPANLPPICAPTPASCPLKSANSNTESQHATSPNIAPRTSNTTSGTIFQFLRSGSIIPPPS